MKTSRLAFVVAWVTTSLVTNIAQAFSITSVTLSPGNFVPATVPLKMMVDIATPGQPPFLYAPTQVSSNAAGVHVEIFPDSGLMTAIGSLQETVALGTFPPGTYSYQVVLHPAHPVNWGALTNDGTFTVLDDLPIVNLELIDPNAMETRIDQNAIFWAEFRVLRTGPATNELFVSLDTSEGSARLGEDYWLDGVTDGTIVRFPAGASSVKVRLYPIDDDVYEGDETVSFHVIEAPSTSAPYMIDVAHSWVSMLIHDNDPVTTRLDVTAPHNGQSFEIGAVIELRAKIVGPGGSNELWSVEFFDGDQLIGTTRPDTSIWWSDASGGPHLVNARATNSHGATLTAGPNSILVGPGATLPVVKISANPWSTGEPCPACLVTPSILTIERTAPTNTALTVFFEIGGTATPGDDYQALPASVEIPAGKRLTQLSVLASDDQLVEGPEVVRVRLLRQPPPLLPPTYFVNAYSNEALITIFDNEVDAPQARLDIIAPTNGSPLMFPSIIQLSALAVNTRNEVYGPVDFFAGDKLVARSSVVASARPALAGLPSIHTAYWTNPAVGKYALTARTVLSLNQSITSSAINVTVDSPTLPVVGLETSPLENPHAPEFCPPGALCIYPSFVVRRTGPTNTELGVYLSYSGTASANVDYPVLPNSLVIPAGHDTASLMLIPKDDMLIEGPETVIASFTPVPGAGYIQDPNHATATIIILDNDEPQPAIVSIHAEDSRATELPPWVDAIDPARFRISRSGDLSSGLTVFFSVGGSATPGVDYQAFASPVLIPAGADSATLVVWPMYDELKEGMETVLIRLEPSPMVGPQRGYDIDPHDNFAVAGIFDLVAEQGPTIQIVSPREGDHFTPPAPVDIIVATFHPTQNILGADFYAGAEKLGEWRLAPGIQNAGTVVSHRFTWSQPPPGTHALTAAGLDDKQTFFATSPPVKVIVEGELPRPIVSIETVSPISEESSVPFKRLPSVGVFRISRNGPTKNALPVFLTYAGTATSIIDYQALPFRVTIPEGTNSTLLAVEPVVDHLTEGLETVLATISNCPPPGSELPCYDFALDPAHSTATVFIRDDGITGASLSINAPTNGASFKSGETIPVEAVAIDLDSYISRVEFFDGDLKIGVSDIVFIQAPPPGTPIQHSFEWHDAAPGSHVLTARAIRTTGELVVSPPVEVAVRTNGNQLPTIAIVQPVNGTEFQPNQAIEIVVETRDPDGYVRTVEFYADGRKLGEISVVFIRQPDPNQPQKFTFLWRNPEPGSHVLTARAIDDAGESTASGPVEIRVTLDSLPIVAVRATDCFAVEPHSNSAPNTATFRLRRFGSTNAPLTVLYSMHGTAQNGVDYEMLSGSAVIPANSFSTTITIRPLADNLIEHLETVVLRLEDQSQYRIGYRRKAVALISDTPPWLGPHGTGWTSLTDGCFHGTFSAPAGGNFRVEASTDLLTWETVATILAADGALEFVEDDMANFQVRYYRLAPEPFAVATE